MSIHGCTNSHKTIDPPERPVDTHYGGLELRLYMVRPARSERRADWSGARALRPLSDAGFAQATGLAAWLGEAAIEAIACGPSLRCRQTLEPLAALLDKPILVDDRLDRDAPRFETVARIRELASTSAVVCVNHSVLQEAVQAMMGTGSIDAETRCERGGAWMIDGEPARAVYFSPRPSAPDVGDPLSTLETVSLGKRAKKISGKTRMAVLDMGSTSFHLLVAEWTPDGELRRVARERVMLRMGSELARSPEISRSLLDRSLEAVENLCAFAREHKAQHLVAVATEALRQASNGPAVLRKLESAIGGPVHLLSGEEEARVVYRAIRSRIDLGQKVHVGLDLGGGSLEIVVGKGRKILFEKTLPLGVARMHGLIEPGDPHTSENLRALRQRVRDEVEPVVAAIQELGPVGCVAVGGTARALGRLSLRDREKGSARLRGLRIERVDLANLGQELCSATLAERLTRPGISSRRADLLPFGAEILACVLSLLGLPSLTICDWGLREGVLLDLVDSQSS